MAPPKPGLTLRIGVTGHRPNRFGETAQQAVRRSLVQVFGEISRAQTAIVQREEAVFAAHPPEIRIVSALAEGADRVAAEVGLAAGFQLDAILPFTAEEYEHDFATQASKAQFRELLARAGARFVLPGERSASNPMAAERAYETAGLMTLRQCDLVIAVWDGEDPAGRGGTEDIVQHAIADGLPVLRYDAHGEGPFLLAAAGKPVDAHGLAAGARLASAQVITDIVERLCAPPGSPIAGHSDRTQTTARTRLKRYLKERQKRAAIHLFAYPLMLKLLGTKTRFWRALYHPRYLTDTEANWSASLTALGPDHPLGPAIRETVMTRFAWADGLASYYGQLHRSGYVGNFVLAAAAVWCAALAVYLGDGWYGGSLGATLIIAINAYLARHFQWRARWMDYRRLSDRLRHLRAQVLIGSITLERPTRTGWVDWYYRMTVREIGLADVTITPDYLKAARAAIADGEIADQLDYHRTNWARMRKVQRSLDRLSLAACAAAFAVCLIEMALRAAGQQSLSELAGNSLSPILIALLAFGAALLAIRMHGDFAGSAKRSQAVAERLEKILGDLRAKDDIGFAELSTITDDAVLAMGRAIAD